MNKRSQIATILTLAIAAIFLFTVIIINIGKVAEEKTVVDNAADAGGFQLASTLGSMAAYLRQELALYEGAVRDCHPNWRAIGGLILIVVGAVLCVFWGAGSPLLALGIKISVVASLAGGAFLVGTDIYNAVVNNPKMLQALEAKYRNMTAEQRVLESTIQTILFSTVSDAALVTDKFDLTREEDNFKINRFLHWYFQRLNSLPRVGEIIMDFYNYLFQSPPYFEIEENAETWTAEEAYFVMKVGKLSTWGKDNAQECLVKVPGGGYLLRVRCWLERDLKSFISFLCEHGYGVDFTCDNICDPGCDPGSGLEDEQSDLGNFYRMILAIENAAKELYGFSLDELIGSTELWLNQFYNPNEEDWYDRLGILEDYLKDWIKLLDLRRQQVLACAHACGGPGPWVCLPGDGDPCCERVCTEECIDPDTGVTYCCGECQCVASCRCNPAGLYDCRLCYEGNAGFCTPDVQCTTPLPAGERDCCTSGCELIIHSAPMLWDTGCSEDPCPANPCCDWTYGPFSGKTHIDPYITMLGRLLNTISNLRADILETYNRVEVIRNDPWRNKAIYIWKDAVLTDFDQAKEELVHMVYVELKLPPKFTLPYPKPEWRFIEVCTTVANAKGTFKIVVARYNEDMAKRGPLSNFWRFIFRRPGPEPKEVAELRNIAARFSQRLDKGDACFNDWSGATGSWCFDELIRPEKAKELGDFAYTHGIASEVEFHYGPGWVYKPEDLPGDPDQRNKEIYIKKRIK